jgi:hypothetical protein
MFDDQELEDQDGWDRWETIETWDIPLETSMQHVLSKFLTLSRDARPTNYPLVDGANKYRLIRVEVHVKVHFDLTNVLGPIPRR